MNTKKILLGLAVLFVAGLAFSCTDSTAEEDALYENSIDREHLTPR